MSARSYVIVVDGHVGPAVEAALGGLSVVAGNGRTTISGHPLDAAALTEVLGVIERFGLDLVSIRSEASADAPPDGGADGG